MTGGPAAGKTTSARQLAATRELGAVVDVDDVRQMLCQGHAAPWAGAEGRRQQVLGVRNACAVARGFVDADVAVIVVDVLSPGTLAIYRAELPDCRIVLLDLTLAEAQRRSAMRNEFLTSEEFAELHASQEVVRSLVDAVVPVGELAVHEQTDALLRVWTD